MEVSGATSRQPAEVLQAKLRFGIVGNAPALIAAIERTLRVAPIDLSVLVTGESGTGKEFFPQIIHAYSARKHAKYIAVNCGAIPEGTIDSELFGHERGSFTGAVASRKGYFEEADGGTIFLDEVAELPLTTQARLLRVLETGEFLKVGSSTVQRTNIRVVAATNVDMQRAVAEGRFREDLYYRLSTVQIVIPPLRDRGSDIGLLARKFAADFTERWRLPALSVTEEARAAMARYSWPGNVRQLKNVVEQMAIFEAGRDIDTATVSRYLPANATLSAPPVPAGGGASSHSYDREREMLFNLILGMQKRIEDLERRLESRGADMPQTAARHGGFVDFADESDSTPPSPGTALVTYRPGPAINIAPRPVTLEDQEREAIRAALERNGGRRKAAADELSISQRTLYRKIKEYGLE